MDEARRHFLDTARQRLLDDLLSGWRRRGSSLLHIGLNGGLSPERFWVAGFDVTALDRSMERLSSCREQTGPKVEYACGSPDLLPFGDGEFDYAVLAYHGLKRRRAVGLGAGLSGEGIPAELTEALRVAARGVIILEWNSFSLCRVPSLALAGEGREPERGVLPWELWALLGRACPGRRRRFLSSLPLWQGAWPSGAEGFANRLRLMIVPIDLTPTVLPLGMLLGVRVDWNSVPLTPAGVLRSAAEKFCPAKPQEELVGRRAMHSALPISSRERKEP
jgi:hypothetical protein